MTWILVANSACCRIFSLDKQQKKLNVIKELIHPESRLKGVDLNADRPGHYKTSGPSHGAYEPHESAHELEILKFSQEIAQEIKAAKEIHHFDKLILVAPPHFLGILHKELPQQVTACIQKEIHKDLNKLSPHELYAALESEL